MKQTVRNTLLAVLTFSCIVAALRGSGLTIPSGTWQPMGNLSAARAGASAALLQDGRILVTGGTGTSGAVPSADFFNPDGTVSPAPAMFNARAGHVSVTLPDGRVLVAGGVSAGGSATSTAEIFDPVANSWTFIGTGMTEARSGATAAVLQDGRVLIAGGQNGTLISSTAEIFDPSTGAFTYVGMMSSPRTQHAMTVLHDGRVLIVGGSNGTAPIASTDTFDPVAGTISAGPSLAAARCGHSATTLINGMVAVIGGNNGNTDPTQADVTPTEIFDPSAATPAFTAISASLATPREGHLAIALPNNGSVLIAGGTSAGSAVAPAELFTPQVSSTGAWTYSFTPAATMSTARSAAADSANQVSAPSTTMQRNGIVAIAGGNDASGNALNTTEAYGYATVQTDQSDYAPGTTVTITGSGFQPGETVNLQLVESPLIDTPGPFAAIADANGNIANTQFVPDAYDVNVRFYLTATGATSGFVAQNTFTDNTSLKDIKVGPQAPNPVAPTGSATYAVTVDFSGNGTCTASLGVGVGGPSGATYSFAPSSGTGTSSGSALTSTLTVTVPPGTTAQTYTFPIVATGTGGNCNGSSIQTDGKGQDSGPATLVVVAPRIASVNVGTQSGTLTYGTPGSATYAVTVTRNGPTGTGFSAALTLTSSLPAGATGAFSPSTLNFGAADTSLASTLTINSAANTPVGSSTSFTVQATNPSVPGDSATGMGSITVGQKTLTVTGIMASDKVYDAITTATLNTSGAALVGMAPGDTVTLSTAGATGTFSDRNVGNNKTVTISGLTIGGASAANYTLTQPTTTASITTKALTYSGLSVPASRTYDGTTNATVSGTATLLTAEAAGSGSTADGKPYSVDAVSLTGSATGTYNSKDVAGATTVTFGGVSLTGSGNGNYTLTALPQAATITAKALTYTGVSVPASRICDGTTNATVSGTAALQPAEAAGSGSASDGKPYTGDTVGVTGTATAAYNFKDVATATMVTFGGLSLNGGQAGDYTLTALTQAATITAKALTYTGVSVPASRIYDGTTNATVSGTAALQPAETAGSGSTADGKPYSGDTVSLIDTPTATYNSKDVATATMVTFAGVSLTGADAGNYSLTGLTQLATITPATLTYTADPATRTYGASNPPFTGSVTGFVSGESQAGATTGTLTFSTTATATSNVGNYPIDGSGLTANGGNYVFTQAAANATALTITKAHLSVTADDKSMTYDGAVFSPFTATLSGFVNGETEAGLRALNTLSGSAGFTGAAATAIDAGSYVITPAAGSLTATNYDFTVFNNGTLTISKADAHISVSPYHVTYDGNQHSATGTATGVETSAADLSSLLNLSGTTHANAGDYPSDGWTFAGNNDYNSANGTIHDQIDKANATINVAPYHVTYDGSPHTATGTATGAKGEDLSGDLDLSHSTHTNAGTYPTDYWTFTDTTGNYNNVSNTTITDQIDQATANITVTQYHVTYDANPHTASGTATGVGGINLSGDLDLSHSTHTNAGTYATDYWTFTDSTGNYKNVSATTITDQIDQATATIAVTSYHVTYDGNPHTASGTATGVGGVNLSSDLDLSHTTHTSVGTYSTDYWTFTDPTGNYKNVAATTITDQIDKANAVINVTPYNVTYDGNAHTATGTATGVKGEALAGLNLSGTTHTAIGDYPSDPWTFTDSTGNYYNANGNVHDNIGYGFIGLEAPYAAPPTTFNVQRTMPLVWQYTNASGVVINSASANPSVTISGPYTCGQADSAGDITVSSAGASGYQYDPTTNTWQFNWQIKGTPAGCYNIYIKSGQSGQTTGPFPISVVSH